MHDLSFRIKRAYWGGIRVFGARVAKFGLTPARFDLLYAIRHDGRGYFPQHALMRKLGVSRATVSKMVRRLVDIGLLKRERKSDFDARTWYLTLTRRARRALWIATRGLVWRGGAHQLYAPCVPTFREKRKDVFANALAVIDDLGYQLDRIARRFGDKSELWYPDVLDDVQL